MLISVILEWENALLSELDRTSRMLYQLVSQAQDSKLNFELVIVFDPNMVSEELITSFIQEALKGLAVQNDFMIRLIQREGLHYFNLKNVGISEANGDVILVLDSDVIPDDFWFSSLIHAHSENPDSVISGLTYIDYSNFVGKCFALCWFFPLPSIEKSLLRTDLIFSNNFLAKKEILIANPYPVMEEGITRGADVILWKQMSAKGIPIFLHRGATVSHPAPNGLGHFVTRALAEGRDDYLRFFVEEFKVAYPKLIFTKTYLYRSKKTIFRIVKNRAKVNLKLWEVPFATVTMLVYYFIFFVGGLATMVAPRFARSKWQI